MSKKPLKCFGLTVGIPIVFNRIAVENSLYQKSVTYYTLQGKNEYRQNCPYSFSFLTDKTFIIAGLCSIFFCCYRFVLANALNVFFILISARFTREFPT